MNANTKPTYSTKACGVSHLPVVSIYRNSACPHLDAVSHAQGVPRTCTRRPQVLAG